jgi:hypothetical protein
MPAEEGEDWGEREERPKAKLSYFVWRNASGEVRHVMTHDLLRRGGLMWGMANSSLYVFT